MMFRGILASALAQTATAVSGAWEGQVPFIIDVNMDFKSDSAVDADINVKVASTRITCPGEKYVLSGSEVSFPDALNDGDCLGDGIRSDSKDPSKYVIEVVSDSELTFKSDGYPNLKMTPKKALKAAAVSGAWEGQVPFIIDVNMDFKSDSAVDADINVKVASKRITCPGEKYVLSGSEVSFPDALNNGDCLGDGIRSDSKDPSKYVIEVVSDSELTFKSDGYPNLKMTPKKALKAAAVSGAWEGQVPFIIDVNMDFKSDSAVDADINVKVAGKRITCPGEKYVLSGSEVSFPDALTDGDCLGDGIRSDSKDPSKYVIEVVSDSELTFKSDGYPNLKMTQKKSAAVFV